MTVLEERLWHAVQLVLLSSGRIMQFLNSHFHENDEYSRSFLFSWSYRSFPSSSFHLVTCTHGLFMKRSDVYASLLRSHVTENRDGEDDTPQMNIKRCSVRVRSPGSCRMLCGVHVSTFKKVRCFGYMHAHCASRGLRVCVTVVCCMFRM